MVDQINAEYSAGVASCCDCYSKESGLLTWNITVLKYEEVPFLMAPQYKYKTIVKVLPPFFPNLMVTASHYIRNCNFFNDS